jgi:hypothetical protein
VTISIDAGAIESFSYSGNTISLIVAQQDGSPRASQAAIWVESTAGATWTATAGAGTIETGRGGWILTLATSGSTTFEVTRD